MSGSTSGSPVAITFSKEALRRRALSLAGSRGSSGKSSKRPRSISSRSDFPPVTLRYASFAATYRRSRSRIMYGLGEA